MRVRALQDIPAESSRSRWTILDVDEKAILKIKVYAEKYNLTTGSALSEVINKALADHYIKDELDNKNKEIKQ